MNAARKRKTDLVGSTVGDPARAASTSDSAASTGDLQIGDQWNAITILAHSQTHPLKAVCELTENAIDAGALQVEFLRFRKGGDTWLQITDDGRGVILADDGLPDFRHIATHICDSMKRQLDESARQNVHGEYGIGLLSFWTLGRELRMASPARDGSYYEMLLRRGEKSYRVQSVGHLPDVRGTRILIGPMLESTRQVVTGEKIQKFLAAELRDRIRSTQARIRVVDRIARKDLLVEPREFEGDRISVPETIATPRGEVSVELYVAGSPSDRGGEICLCKDGTRVLNHIGELLHFEGEPWDDPRLCGRVDYPLLLLAPGTRQGVVPDENLDHLVAALNGLRGTLRKFLQQRTLAENEEASRRIQRKVHKALKSAICDLPETDYLFFDLPGRRRKKRDSTAKRRKKPPRTLPFAAGPMSAVSVTPATARCRPGEAAVLKALVTDDDGFALLQEIQFDWTVLKGNAVLTPDGATCHVVSDEQGIVQVQVTATQDRRSVKHTTQVRFLNNERAVAAGRRKGLPAYRLMAQTGSPQRSHYDRYTNEIIINSAHKDFVESNSSPARHRRYIGKLYAKEVVLLNFPDAPPSVVAERLIELMVRTEENL